MKEKLTHISHKIHVLLLVLLLNPVASWAALPSVQDPNAKDGAMGTMKTYGATMIDLAGLFVCAIGFVAVAWHSVAVFSAVQSGKKTWAELFLCLGVGALMLVGVIWFLNQSTGILS